MASKKSQKALLQKLQEYGDSLLEEENQTTKKKKNQIHNTETETELVNSEDPNLHVTPSKQKKKKLNKKQRKLLKKQQNGDIEKSKKKTPLSKKMKWLKEALGSDGAYNIQPRKKDTTDANISAKKSLKRKREPEVIVFEDPTQRKRSAAKEVDTSQTDSSRDFDMKSARFEVRKLGISGFAGEKKTDARVSLLINLGAKPPRKKSYTNYKEFQRQRKNDLDAEKQKRQDEQVPGEKVAKKKPKKKSRTKSDIDSQMGPYKDGVQFISKETLKRLKQRS